MTLVLASGSATRRAMLDQCGIAHEVDPARVDERTLEAGLGDADPYTIAMALAEAKALDVSARHSGASVLGGDSVVTVAGRRFDKPANRQEAAEHLGFFSGKVIELWSAAALARDSAVVERVSDKAELAVRALSDEFIERYLAEEWPEVGFSVGVFRIEALGPLLFDRVVGDYFTILGMPLMGVLGALRRQGVLAT
jgi:septum formation protein